MISNNLIFPERNSKYIGNKLNDFEILIELGRG